MVSFYQLYESISSIDTIKDDIPFQIENKSYILRFFGRPTYELFPYGSYIQGHIFDVVFFPADKSDLDSDEKYVRTGDNSVRFIRTLLRTLPTILINWIEHNKPTGYYWTGNDSVLRAIWDRLAHQLIAPGYVWSKTKNHILVQAKLQPLIDKFSIN